MARRQDSARVAPSRCGFCDHHRFRRLSGARRPDSAHLGGLRVVYAIFLHRSDRRPLAGLMGMAAGLSAIFRSPIGTALFCRRVLYGGIEFEAEALMYCLFAPSLPTPLTAPFRAGIRSSRFRLRPASGDWPMTRVVRPLDWLAASRTILPGIFYRVRDAFYVLPIPNMDQTCDWRVVCWA